MPINLYDSQTKQLIQAPDAESVKQLLSTNRASFGNEQDVPMKGPDGELYTVKGKDAPAYIFDKGYTPVSEEQIQAKAKAETYSTPAQKAMTFVEGGINSAGLGFGNALTKTAIALATPKGSDLDKRYAKAVEERKEENPLTSFAGDVAGIAVDPFGIGEVVSMGAKAAGKGVAVTGEVAAKLKAPKLIADVVLGKTGVRAVEFGLEGSAYSAGYEAGRELLDDKPINSDAIIDSGKHGFLLGAGLGGAIGATEQAAAKALSETKSITKKYLDKITNAPEEARSEIFKESPTMSLEKNLQEKYGRKQKSIKFEEAENGNLSYNDGKRQGVIESLSKDAKGLDLTDPASIDQLGKKLNIDDLNTKIKFNKADESLADFLAQEKNAQIIENQVKAFEPYMNEGEKAIYGKIKQAREAFSHLKNVGESDIYIMDQVKNAELRLFNMINPEYAEAVRSQPSLLDEIYKSDLDFVKRNMSEYDYVKDFGENGAKEIHVYNENVLPDSITTKAINKGTTPLSFESKELSRQLGVTAKKMDKMGNARLNEVSNFILDHYPKEGSIFKKATTSLDYILQGINDTKTKAISELEETINHALNIGGVKEKLTTDDIARYIESQILPNYTDRATGNAISGFEKQYNQVKEFADSYRNNGYRNVVDKYGVQQKEFLPLDVKQIRQIRVNLDKIAEFATDTDKAVVKAARDTRFWLEDKVIDRVGALDKNLVDRYVKAKTDYRNALDAEKIVSLATKKAAQKSGFNLLYSGISAMIGGGFGGPTGAVVGGLLGGAAKNTMNEFSGTLSIFLTKDLAKNIDKYESTIEKTAKAFFSPVKEGAKLYLKVPNETDHEIAKKDMNRLAQELNNRDQYVQDFVDKNDYLFANLPQTSKKVLEASLRARDFLITKIPKNPFAGNPLREDKWEPSPAEINKYMRYREAVNKPSVILEQIKNGYVTPEAVEVLDQVYPDTKQALAEKFVENLKKGQDIPVEKRQELYKVFGIKLDSFNNPQTFLDLQNKANAQANASKMENMGQMRPNNAFKIKDKDLSLGNRTLKD